MITKPDTVVFDPALKEHRAAVRAFMKRKAWADSPIKFKQDPAFASVADMVQTKLLQWFLEQEEQREAKRLSKAAEKPEPKGRKPAEKPTRQPALHEVKKLDLSGLPRSLLKRA